MSATVAFLAFPEVEELDLVGPWEVFRMWAREPGGPARCLVVAESAEPVVCAKGLRLLPDAAFSDCPFLDYLLVPGGMGTRREADNPALLDFVARQAATCQSVLSVCTGAFLLHEAGLLEGRRATTHWRSLDRLRECGVVVSEERFVRDGDVWTSAGVSAGIDMALAFVAAVAGTAVAGRVQRNMEYYPTPTLYTGDPTSDRIPKYVSQR